MDLLNIAPNQVNFKAQTQTKPATSPIQAAKEKFDNMDNGEKIVAGLTGLGVLALATLAIAKGRHKAVEVPKPKIKPDVAQQGANVIDNVTNSVRPTISVSHTPRLEKRTDDFSQGIERAQQAAKEYSQGGNYGKIKKEATRNLSHDGKKVTKELLSEAHSKKSCTRYSRTKS